MVDGDADVARWIRPEVRALSSYHVTDPGECVKLDAMENPYSWPPQVVEEWLERLRGVCVNRYPDPEARVLAARLRTAMAVPEDAALLLGNGSDELIQIIALAVSDAGRTVLTPEPTFVIYRSVATVCGLRYASVPLRATDFALDMEAMRRAITRYQPAVIFLASPNNPTGNVFAAEEIAEIIDLAPGLVVIDEAYAPFARISVMDQVGCRENLLVMRTLSKVGLAGLRLGVLAGTAGCIRELNKIRLPYNVNTLTQVSAEFALTHQGLFDEQIRKIRHSRSELFRALQQRTAVHPWPSQANFLLFRVSACSAASLFDGLRARGVLIKNMDGSNPLLANCLRVTVGTAAENRVFLNALDRALLW